MSSWSKYSILLVLVLSLASASCNSNSINEENTTADSQQVTKTPNELDSSETEAEDPFREAVNNAMAAAEAAQSAQIPSEWENVVTLWQQSIKLMKAVPKVSENYQIAQQKIIEYQPNLEYALANASIDISCNSESLTFYVKAPITGNGTQFAVETNLPDATEIGFNLKGNGYTGQSKVAVQDGQIVSENFTNKGSSLNGEYTLEILSYFNQIWQSEELISKLNGYSSPCISEGADGRSKVLRKAINLSLGNSEVARQAIQNENAEARAIINEAKELLAVGKQNLVALQQNPDAPICFKDLQNRMNRAKDLRARADKLQSQQWFELRVAVVNLVNCSTCDASTVETYCSEAEAFLQQAEQALKE